MEFRARSPQPLLAALPPILPGNSPGELAPSEHPALRRWNITHACENADDIVPLAHAQREVGMRPSLLTPSGWFNPGVTPNFAAPFSLIHTWRAVRHWRSVFEREDVGHPGEIVHAHCFGAGMAGVRSNFALVYDVTAPLGSTPKAGPWLLRSLSVAESFVLSRASSVVVHSNRMWSWALEQGARADDVFLVPEPVLVPSLLLDETSWLVDITGRRPAVTLFAPLCGNNDAFGASALRSFALLCEEVEDAYLLIESVDAQSIRTAAAGLKLAGRVHAISPGDRVRALTASDIVIAGPEDGPNHTAIEALAYGRTLLAADVDGNREVSPQGRGCLWFAAGNDRDLAHRAAFLARNPDFRVALAATGRTHVQATRGFPTIARMYDDVYRHAIRRYHAGNRPDIFRGVPVLAVC